MRKVSSKKKCSTCGSSYKGTRTVCSNVFHLLPPDHPKSIDAIRKTINKLVTEGKIDWDDLL